MTNFPAVLSQNLLDNADVFGFVNVTGYNDDYANGTPSPNSQIGNNPPVSSYFWLNSLHPTWPGECGYPELKNIVHAKLTSFVPAVHNLLAHSIATFLVST